MIEIYQVLCYSGHEGSEGRQAEGREEGQEGSCCRQEMRDERLTLRFKSTNIV